MPALLCTPSALRVRASPLPPDGSHLSLQPMGDAASAARGTGAVLGVRLVVARARRNVWRWAGPATSLGSQVLLTWAVLVNRRGAVCVPGL